MKFFVIPWRGTYPQSDNYPYVVLVRDNWNDYGYRTLFHPTIHTAQNESVDLRDVKILKLGPESLTEIDEEFEELDDSYCSLGQELAYYESLLTLPDEIWREYLSALKDAAANPAIRDRFRAEDAFGVSLLRWGPAERALEDAPALLLHEDALSTPQSLDENKDELLFTFTTKFGANKFDSNFRYCQMDKLPGRINAIIGYNGTGKTQLLANLAWVARAELGQRDNNETVDDYGSLQPKNLRFGRVVAISYSAFDTFRVPPDPGRGNDFGYTYCGLRRFTGQGATPGLKDVKEIANELADAISRINTPNRRQVLEHALKPLREEPSFKGAGSELDVLENSEWREEFDRLSTGHKISMNIIVQLVGSLQNRSLVLIDEPESHLHPPLLAALMKGIGIALEAHKSYAVIATHSPVVLQEIAGRYAHVLRRHGSLNFVEEPTIETFGENIGLLTRHVFNLDNSSSDFVGKLQELAVENSLEDIEELFRHGLSSQARNLVMQAQRR